MEGESYLSKRYKSKLPDQFPQELLNMAKSLEHLGLSEMAWDFETAIRVVEFLYESNYAILGGDVYRLIDGNLYSTYDSWYLNRDETISKPEFIEQSRTKAVSYITNYFDKNNKSFYYSIVFDTL
jgi:hypothetical protein